MKLIHYAPERIGPLYSVAQHSQPAMKPQGLWVSVEGPDDWKSWCESEEFGLDRLAVPHEIALADDARILRLSDASAIHAFTEEFRQRSLPVSSLFIIRWDRVAAAFQGVVLAPYCWECRLDWATSWYYAWDCASGCIWDSDAVEAVRCPPITAPSPT